jgi:hypothetical protein
MLSTQEEMREAQSVIGALGKLKFQMQTNKAITDLDDVDVDVSLWNDAIKSARGEKEVVLDVFNPSASIIFQ